MKYPKGSFCPVCKSKDSYSRIKNRKGYQCSLCRNQIYPMVGTIYQKTTTPLTIWFEAMFLFIKSKNGLSAMELQRITGLTYKTAYRILMSIRKCLYESDERFTGISEVDETFIGGLNKNRHYDKKVPYSQGRSVKDKTPVFGVYNRDSKTIRAFVVKNTSRASLVPHIKRNAEKGSHIMSDEWKAYNGLKKRFEHSRVHHKGKEFVNGETSTNHVENFWSVFKRTIKGSYIVVSRKRLQLYVNESVFKYNNRDNPFIFQDLLSFACLSEPFSNSPQTAP